MLILSAHREDTVRRLAAPDITGRKGGEPLVCLTAYTAPIAAALDESCDVLLVGDSLGMVVHGLPNTVGVTLEMMILHGQAVMRGSRKAMVVVDMPFGSYEGAPEEAYANAVRIMKETGCQAVKVESGPTVPATIAYLVQRGIPVMGHVGLRPQAVLVDGGFKAKGKDEAGRLKVLEEARARPSATPSTTTAKAPASAGCDGQILVVDDMLGLFDWAPKFVRRYADLKGEIERAAADYARDVKARTFPGEAETYYARKN